jgi:hypothetical protein
MDEVVTPPRLRGRDAELAAIRRHLGEGFARLAPGGVRCRHSRARGPFTGQAVGGGLARGGQMVVLGYSAGTETTLRITDLVWKVAQLSGLSLPAVSLDEQAEAYAKVLPLIASGKIAPAQDRSFPLDQAPEALRHPDRGPTVRQGDANPEPVGVAI